MDVRAYTCAEVSNNPPPLEWTNNALVSFVPARRYFAILTIVVRRSLYTATRKAQEWFFSNINRGVLCVL